MSAATHLMTAEELIKLPGGSCRYELVKGELLTMPLAGEEHGVLIMNIALPLAQHVRRNDLGIVYGADTGFQIESNPDTVLGPDIAFVLKDRLKETGISSGYRVGAPDLAVEVISPRDSSKRVEQKVQRWLAGGALTVWTVDPKTRTVKVYQSNSAAMEFGEADVLTGGTILPGFKLPVTEIFI
jgi:Uma2 family endonuclease